MIVPGLISVTFRQRSVEDIATLAAAAGLRAIEWGADVHVRPGDDHAADCVARAAADHGLAITGYGSYHRAGDDPPRAFGPILDTALRLGAPSIRVWAGARVSVDADDAYRASVIEGVAAAVEQAAAGGVEVALEFHAGTLTDTPAGAVELCRTTRARSHWQPPVGLDDDDALAGLDALAGRLSAVHVFSWDATGRRLPLAARHVLWRRALDTAAALPGDHPALLEFVADDDPANLAVDAATLLELLDAVAA